MTFASFFDKLSPYLTMLFACGQDTTTEIASSNFELRAGDLLFQDLDCGAMCNAITGVTSGVNDTNLSHVGMVRADNSDGNAEVIESRSSTGVHVIALKEFFNNGGHDSNGKPRVIVGRLKARFQGLIAAAVANATSWIDLPYNKNFTPDNSLKSFYCSQLIYDAFLVSNQSIFLENKMTFNGSDNRPLKEWVKYFNSLNCSIPEGQRGTNPGMMSRSENLTIVHAYGELRKREPPNVAQIG